MIIKQVHFTSFGAIENKDVKFDEGLNIIIGENEAGKSTTADLVRFVLYGFGKNDKEKFTPFGKDSMSGSITIESGGKIYNIERIQSSKTSVSVTEGGNKVNIGDMEPGEYFTGLPTLELFESTVFAGSDGAYFKGDENAFAAIENIVTGGNEKYSAKKAKASLEGLRKYYRLLKGNGGKCYELECELSKLKAEKISASHNADEIKVLEKELDSYLDKQNNLPSLEDKAKKTEEDYKIYKMRLMGIELEKEYALFQKADDELTKFENEHNYKDRMPEQADLGKVTLAEGAVNTGILAVADADNGLFEKNNEYNEADREYREAKAANQIEIDRKQRKKRLFEVAFYTSIGAMAIGFVLCIVFMMIGKMSLIWTTAVKFGTGFCGFMLTFGRAKKVDGEIKTLAEMKDETENKAQAKENLNYAIRKKEEADAYLKNAKKALAELCENWKLTSDTPSKELGEIMDRARALNDAVEDTRERYFDHKRDLDTSDIKDDGREISIPDGYDDGSFLTVTREIGKLGVEYAEAVSRLNIAIGNARNGSRPIAVIDEEIDQKTRELEDAKGVFSSTNIAIEALDEAANEIRNSISPRIADGAGKRMDTLTGGKYSSLSVSSSLGVSYKPDESGKERDNKFMSTGTRDASYIALRLALAETISSEALPFILDETLVHLDDKRMTKCLEMLSGENQVLLFTVSDREERLIKANGFKATVQRFAI